MLARGGRARRADRAPRPGGQLLAVRPNRPGGPCSELYLDRGPKGPDSDRPGDDTERFLEYWNLVFMQYDLGADGSLTPLPSRNIDTGMGLDRMAAILQGVESVFETDQLRPLVDLGEELSGRSYGQDEPTTRAVRILADHGRAAAFLLADGVVPSNEDRGYILRRIMRRAMHQGRVLGIAEGFLPRLVERAVEVMGDAYPELREEWPNIERWARAEEEGFGRTPAQGERLLAELADAARAESTSWISAEDAFKLHDTFGFPYEMTKELLAEQGLSVDDQGFEELMDQAREVSRAGARGDGDAGPHGGHEEVARFTRGAGFATRFVGYEQTEAETVLGAAEADGGGRVLAKLEESPFYPEGGGQVSDTGIVESPSGRARVTDVYRLGDDQALALEPIEGEIGAGEAVTARVERDVRLATMRNHTATHLLHAALRERLGPHVRQAGVVRGPGQAALRLHPRRAPEPRGAGRRGGHGPRMDRRQPSRPCHRDHAGGGRGAGRHGPLRREVRRVGAHGGDRRRLAGAARRHARAEHRRARPVPPPQRDLQRLERPPHRGGDRGGRLGALPEPDRAAAGAGRAAAACPSPRWCAPWNASPSAPRSCRRRRPASWTATPRRGWPGRRTRSAGCGSWWRSCPRRTRRRCSSSRSRCVSGSATRRWCSVRPWTAECTSWPTSRPRPWSAA